MKKPLILTILCLGLAACGQEAAYYDSAPMADEAFFSGGADMMEKSVASPAPPPPVAPGEPSQEALGGRMLAYEYSATLQVPAGSVGAVMKAHMARCESAGPQVCQVISSNTNESNEDYAWAGLELRAGRDWLQSFRAGLEGDAESAKGRLASTNMSAEDLTRTITDTSARLEAQETLRDRLLVLLEKDTDEVGDLLQIERELARVQGDIESARSYLRVLQARVSMDRMSLSYQTLPQAVSSSTFDSLGDAFKRFFGVLSDSLATMVLFFAAVLPWLIIAVPVLWLLIRGIRRLFRNRKAA